MPAHLTDPCTPASGGCRIASPAYRHSQQFCEQFMGLEEGVNRYDLLLLVKKLGEQAGFTPRMVQLLDYLMAFTRDCDWEEGSRPIVYQSLSRTALDLGVSERQIQKLEQALFQRGALTWNDSGNHKRYGQRDPATGRILYAFGVELTPLAALKGDLQARLAEKQRHDRAWMETKRQISWHRSQLRATLQEWREEGADTTISLYQQRYGEIAIQIRSSVSLQKMQALLARHKALLSDLRAAATIAAAKPEEGTSDEIPGETTPPCTASSEPEFVHNEPTTQESLNEFNTGSGRGVQERARDCSEQEGASEKAGVQHVTIGMVADAASERFRFLLPSEPSWSDLVDAASLIRRELRISQDSWAEACQILGRNGAALCVLITDQASLRSDDPVRQPAAYFRAMIHRAKRGELSLYRSLFGLLNRHGWAVGRKNRAEKMAWQPYATSFPNAPQRLAEPGRIGLR